MSYYPFILGTYARLNSYHLHSEIIDRLDGSEDYRDEFGNKIYSLKTIERIVNDPEDDTNESTKNRLVNFYNALRKTGADRVLIVNVY